MHKMLETEDAKTNEDPAVWNGKGIQINGMSNLGQVLLSRLCWLFWPNRSQRFSRSSYFRMARLSQTMICNTMLIILMKWIAIIFRSWYCKYRVKKKTTKETKYPIMWCGLDCHLANNFVLIRFTFVVILNG